MTTSTQDTSLPGHQIRNQETILLLVNLRHVLLCLVVSSVQKLRDVATGQGGDSGGGEEQPAAAAGPHPPAPRHGGDLRLQAE